MSTPFDQTTEKNAEERCKKFSPHDAFGGGCDCGWCKGAREAKALMVESRSSAKGSLEIMARALVEIQKDAQAEHDVGGEGAWPLDLAKDTIKMVKARGDWPLEDR